MVLLALGFHWNWTTEHYLQRPQSTKQNNGKWLWTLYFQRKPSSTGNYHFSNAHKVLTKYAQSVHFHRSHFFLFISLRKENILCVRLKVNFHISSSKPQQWTTIFSSCFYWQYESLISGADIFLCVHQIFFALLFTLLLHKVTSIYIQQNRIKPLNRLSHEIQRIDRIVFIACSYYKLIQWSILPSSMWKILILLLLTVNERVWSIVLSIK